MPVSDLIQLARHRSARSGLTMYVLPLANCARVRRHPPAGHWSGFIVEPNGDAVPVGGL
jgi:hypothetical protein